MISQHSQHEAAKAFEALAEAFANLQASIQRSGSFEAIIADWTDTERASAREILSECIPSLGCWFKHLRKGRARTMAKPKAVTRQREFMGLWKPINQFLASLPRRGGWEGLTRDWTQQMASAALVSLLELQKSIEEGIAYLRGVFPGIDESEGEGDSQ